MSAEALSIREATTKDAGALLALKRALDHETTFMLLEPGERATTVSQLATELRAIAAQSNSVVLVAQGAGDLVGYDRSKHRNPQRAAPR